MSFILEGLKNAFGPRYSGYECAPLRVCKCLFPPRVQVNEDSDGTGEAQVQVNMGYLQMFLRQTQQQ